MKARKITANSYYSAVYPGINVGFIKTDNGVIAIDAPPLPTDARAWQKYIVEATGMPIRYVILTDHHPARVASAGLLKAPVIAGESTFDAIKNDDWDRQAAVDRWKTDRPKATAGLDKAKPPLPQLTVQGRLVIHGSPQVVVEAVAGASFGSIWVAVPDENVLFAGETITIGHHPSLIMATDTRAWLQTLVHVRRPYFPYESIIPGSGKACKPQDTQPLSEYLQLVRRRVRSMHIAERSRSDTSDLVEELIQEFPVKSAARERTKAQIEAGLRRVYDELRPENPA